MFMTNKPIRTPKKCGWFFLGVALFPSALGQNLHLHPCRSSLTHPTKSNLITESKEQLEKTPPKTKMLHLKMVEVTLLKDGHFFQEKRPATQLLGGFKQGHFFG